MGAAGRLLVDLADGHKADLAVVGIEEVAVLLLTLPGREGMGIRFFRRYWVLPLGRQLCSVFLLLSFERLVGVGFGFGFARVMVPILGRVVLALVVAFLAGVDCLGDPVQLLLELDQLLFVQVGTWAPEAFGAEVFRLDQGVGRVSEAGLEEDLAADSTRAEAAV